MIHLWMSLLPGSPPPTRGTLRPSLIMFSNAGITPAYAGNTTIWNDNQYTDKDHPRLRGEHVLSLRFASLLAGSPPPTRGTPTARLGSRRTAGITPAYAGNTVSGIKDLKMNWDHPRLRGEHTPKAIEVLSLRGSPPPTRGTPDMVPYSCSIFRITPAYAGNTLS